MQARITREVRTTQEQSAGNSVRVWRQKGWGWRVPARLGAAISAVKSGEPQMCQHCATNASVNPRGSSISGMKAVLIAMRDRIGGAMRDGEGGRAGARGVWNNSDCRDVVGGVCLMADVMREGLRILVVFTVYSCGR